MNTDIFGTPLRRWWPRIDRVWAATLLGILALALFDAAAVPASLGFVLDSLAGIAPYLAASVAIAAYTRASGLDGRIAAAFEGGPLRAIVLAALFGALSPFCSCGVVPIIAALLVAGVPLAPVMAFWLASPLMDPEMFLLTFGVFGLEFTGARTLGAIGVGLVGGAAAHGLTRGDRLGPVLRPEYQTGGCGGLPRRSVAWAFWRQPERRAVFAGTTRETGLFLLKWLVLAFFVQSLMVARIPAEAIAATLGGEAWWAVPAAIAVGIPSYLNGYAAIPLVAGLLELGMSPQAGLAFMLAGGVTSIPAALAVWAVVRARVFVLYLGAGLAGVLLMSYAYGLYLAVAG